MTISSIWKKGNIAPITKMGIEGTVAAASLATAVATILIATNVIAGPAFLASVANPVGIAALFVAAVYFAAAAYLSYQQMHATQGDKGEILSDEDFRGKLSTQLSNLEVSGSELRFKTT
ncbi:MAG: hypothetical protein LBC06_02820 [Rickettsiales bacterium]|jgi:hypothetical protein|nr:hypothetical protein [Rickettsiales bacterium]